MKTKTIGADNNTQSRSEIIRSSALFLGQVEVTEDAGSHGSRAFSGTRIKAVAAPLLYKMLKSMPVPLALAPAKIIIGLVRSLYSLRNNSFRHSCQYICRIAEQAGYDHKPYKIYQQSLTNAYGTLQNYFRLYSDGKASVIDYIKLQEKDALLINETLTQYGGLVIAVPHNYGSVFSAMKMHKAFPLLIVSRNSSTIDRTKIAVEYFERMGIDVLLVRGGNPFELSRTLFKVLKKGKAVAATVDSLDHSEGALNVKMFGEDIGFSPWAAKIAIKMKVPVIPSFFHSKGRVVEAVYGNPLVTDNVQDAVQHYATFFERQILKDPASWAYLGDKRWRKVLRKAAG
jgi:lauroyl/myristoyl acyltransferase